jgi:hypothetical protein
MSLALEFLTPQNPETSAAGIGTNWCFPTIARAAPTTDCSGGTTPRPTGSTTRGDQPTSHPGQSARFGRAIPDRDSNTSELPVNDLLTNPGNSD